MRVNAQPPREGARRRQRHCFRQKLPKGSATMNQTYKAPINAAAL